MGYYVRRLQKKSGPQWKLQYISHKKEHTRNSTAKSPTRTWDIPLDRWSELGFRKYMTIDQARIRSRQLNAQINLKRHEENRLKYEAEVKTLELKCAGFLPTPLLRQFEERYFSGSRLQRVLQNKELSHWRAAQKLILELQLEPSDWYDETHQIYDWFHKKRFGISYIKKIIRIMNLWGFFFARKMGKSFLNVRFPRGLEKDRLLDAYFTKKRRTILQSDPLQPHQP